MKPKLSILDPNPTPLQYLSGLSQELFREIYIKRDDLTPFGGGGNKLRKLEYLMIEALNSQATTIVTVGGPQTNHGRLTAAVAAKFGLKCIIVAVGDTDGELSGNLLLDGIFGARIVLKHDDARDQAEGRLRKLFDCCAADKKTNDAALNPKNPCWVLSVYKFEDGRVLWVITEWDRSATTALLPDEY